MHGTTVKIGFHVLNHWDMHITGYVSKLVQWPNDLSASASTLTQGISDFKALHRNSLIVMRQSIFSMQTYCIHIPTAFPRRYIIMPVAGFEHETPKCFAVD